MGFRYDYDLFITTNFIYYGGVRTMQIARVFPTKTNACPDDKLAFFDYPDLLSQEMDIDEVHVSVTFSWDITKGYKLADAWSKIAPVQIGGVAFGSPATELNPGMYVKKGMLISTRGCNNKCWFCDVHKREGKHRTIGIKEGFNEIGSNLTQAPIEYFKEWCEMSKNQKERAVFSGGLEAKLLTKEHVKLLWDIRPKTMFFAYDTPDDLEPLYEASKMLRYANFTRGHMQCYVLIGYPKDTFELAQKRLLESWDAGYLPFAMLYRDKEGKQDEEWKKFQRQWCRPAITKSIIRDIYLTNKL